MGNSDDNERAELMAEVEKAAEQAVAKHDYRKLARWFDWLVKACIILGIPWLVSDRMGIGTRIADGERALTNQISALRVEVTNELARIKVDVAATSAARASIIEDYRLNMARMEGQLEGTRRDIQSLAREVSGLSAELKLMRKDGGR